MNRLESSTARLRSMLLTLPSSICAVAPCAVVTCAVVICAVAMPVLADVPPNTERARPDSPPSDALIDRLITAKAAAPIIETPPETRLELLDTTRQANFDSGSDELTPSARAKLDEFAAPCAIVIRSESW